MSNGTQEHNPNRNRNNNRNRNRNRNGENRSNDNRNNENRNRSQGGNPNKPRAVSQHQSFVNRAPAKKLSLWQKIMKMIGLYKEPVKPSRDTKPNNRDEARSDSPRGPRPEKQAPRSNTRDARNTGEARPPREQREPREPRAPREPRERREPSLADVESTRLYIGNLSYDASESDIEELFKGVGPVRNVEIVYNKHTHKSKGYGFVEMLRIDEAKRAVEVLHDQHFMGRQLIVSGAKAKNAEEGEAAVAVREDKEQAKEQAAAEARAATAAAASAAAVVAADTFVEETPLAEVEEVASVTETTEIVEEIHSLEGDAQKETFV